MFQTEFVLFIQSFATDFWTGFFKFWTEIGYSRWSNLVLMIVLFGVSFRSGLVMVHAVLWNGMTTGFLKEFFALPRPANVDVRVELPAAEAPNPTTFEAQGAKSFFGGLPRDVVAALRASPIDSWGFPSGHTSNATAVWGFVLLLFKKTWIRIAAVAMIVFIPLSRIYLGRHFLADVLAGYVLGIVFLLLFYRLVLKSRWFVRAAAHTLKPPLADVQALLLWSYLLLLPLILLAIPQWDREGIATLLGLNLGLILVWRRGLPDDAGNLGQRVVRILIAVGFYLGGDFLFSRIISAWFQQEPAGALFFSACLRMVLVLWGTSAVCLRLGLYQRKSQEVPPQ